MLTCSTFYLAHVFFKDDHHPHSNPPPTHTHLWRPSQCIYPNHLWRRWHCRVQQVLRLHLVRSSPENEWGFCGARADLCQYQLHQDLHFIILTLSARSLIRFCVVGPAKAFASCVKNHLLGPRHLIMTMNYADQRFCFLLYSRLEGNVLFLLRSSVLEKCFKDSRSLRFRF